MKRKAQQSNHSFLLGTLALGILVIGVVILFTALAYNLNEEKKYEQIQIARTSEDYHCCLNAGFSPTGCSVFLNDILLYSGKTEKDTILTLSNVKKEDIIIIVDHITDKMKFVEIPPQKGNFHFIKDSEGIRLVN